MEDNELTDEEKALLEEADASASEGLAGNPQAPGLAASDSEGPVSDNRMREPTGEAGEKAPQEGGAGKRTKKSSTLAKAEQEGTSLAAGASDAAGNPDPSKPAQYDGGDDLPAQMSYDQ